MEKEKTRQADIKATARTERIQAVAVAVGVIAVVGIITGAIWTGLTQSSERRQEQIIVCTESGGTMVDTTGGPLWSTPTGRNSTMTFINLTTTGATKTGGLNNER